MSDNRKEFENLIRERGGSRCEYEHEAYEIWQSATEQSSKEIERLNELVEMQADALKKIGSDTFDGDMWDMASIANTALSASSETVAKWEAAHAAKVLEEFIKTLRGIPSIGLSERQFGELERANKVKE